MKKLIFSAPLAALFLSGCGHFQTPQAADLPEPPEPAINRFADVELRVPDWSLAAYEDAGLDILRSPVLSKFRSEEEFLSWLEASRAAAGTRGVHWWSGMPPVAMSAPPPPPPPPAPPPPGAQSAPAPTASAPAAAESAPSVTVTGSTASSENPEITNNQKAGVDEGSIVKQIGRHLVVLQDGRLFITDLMPGGEAGLKLVDRADVYRSSEEDTWYDEILVAGRTILVTGYSYRESASEFTVLTLGEDGKVTRDATF